MRKLVCSLFLAGSCAAAAEAPKRMNFISIVRFTPDGVPGMAAEARRHAEASGVRKLAYSMSLLPKGKDPLAQPRRSAACYEPVVFRLK